MDVLVIIITTSIIALIFVMLTFAFIKRKQSNKYKKEISNLDLEKNQLVGVPILSEFSKVKELVKTDNLKSKLDDWDATFKLIKDEEVPKINDMISDVEFLVDKKDYKQAIKKIAYIEMEIMSLKKKSAMLVNEIRVITTSEQRNRSAITKLKINYRELESKFERTKKDYGVIADSIEKKLHEIEEEFQNFESAMDINDYVLVEKIVDELEEQINNMKIIIEEVPSIVLTSTVILPNKIEEITTLYFRMLRDGYPLDYLNVEYNIKEIKDKNAKIIENLKDLVIGDSKIELKTMIEYFNSLYIDFDREKESKDIFKENTKSLKYKLDKINKIVKDIYLQIDDIKSTYDLTEDAINKFSELNKKLEKLNEDYKILVSHGNGHTFAYSKLVEELDGVNIKLSRLQDDLDYQLRSITSMKDDETRAKEELESIQDVLKQAKSKLKEYKIPVIPSSYFIELKEAQDAIREVAKELDKKPIVIKILNIRVDTARDLVFKIYNKTNDMVKLVKNCEGAIVYGNRYRSVYKSVDETLSIATTLFERGQYQLAYDKVINALDAIDNTIKNKFL